MYGIDSTKPYSELCSPSLVHTSSERENSHGFKCGNLGLVIAYQLVVSMHLSSFAMPAVAQIYGDIFIMPQGPSGKTSVIGFKS